MIVISFLVGIVDTFVKLFCLCVDTAFQMIDHSIGLREKPQKSKELHRIGYGGEYINERGEIVRR